jgi:hypothetical protein
VEASVCPGRLANGGFNTLMRCGSRQGHRNDIPVGASFGKFIATPSPRYRDYRAIMAIQSLELREGMLPASHPGHGMEWAALYQAERPANWTMLAEKGMFERIAPLVHTLMEINPKRTKADRRAA